MWKIGIIKDDKLKEVYESLIEMSFLDSLFSSVWKQMGTEIYARVDIYICTIFLAILVLALMPPGNK